MGLKAKIITFSHSFFPNYYVCREEVGAGSSDFLSSNVLPTLGPHQPCHQQSLPKGVMAMCPALPQDREWAREPTHSITVGLSFGKVILLPRGPFTVGKGNLLVKESRAYRNIFSVSDSRFSPTLEQMECIPR